MLQRFRQYRGLHQYNTFINDNSPRSLEYFNIEFNQTELTSGQNALWIYGTNKFVSDTPLLIEVLDSNNTPVYHEVTSVTDALNRRLISIWVRNFNSRGMGTITIIGEIESQFVPSEWVGRYNCKWSIPIFIDPLKPNNSEIHFEVEPRIYTIGFKTTSKEISPVNFIFNNTYLSASAGLVSYLKNSVNSEYYSDIEDRKFQSQKFGESSAWSQLSADQKNGVTLRDNFLDSRKNIDEIVFGEIIFQRNSPYTLYASTPIFNSNMVGGTIEIIPTGSSPVYSTEYVTSSLYEYRYRAQIINVINARTLQVDRPFQINLLDANSNVVTHEFTSFSPSKYIISYSFSNEDVQYLTSSIVPRLSVDIQFANVFPASGDIFRIKTFAKRRNIDPEYTLISDQPVKPQELLVDPYYPNQTTFKDIDVNKRFIGIFRSNSEIQFYWVTQSIGEGNINRSAIVDSTNIDSVRLYPWYSSSNSDLNHILFYPKGNYTFIENSTMCLSCKVYSEYDSESLTYPELEIFLSGSSFYEKNPPYPVSHKHVNYGKFIGRIKNNERTKNYGLVKFNFTVDRDGYAKPIFKIIGGRWSLGEISIKPAEEFGFTPDNFNYTINLPYDISSSVDLKFEYFSQNGQAASYTSYVNNLLLQQQFESKKYVDAQTNVKTSVRLFDPPVYSSSSYDFLHEYNLNRNVKTINGIVEAVRKSDIYTRAGYINLIQTKSSSINEFTDAAQVVPPSD